LQVFNSKAQDSLGNCVSRQLDIFHVEQQGLRRAVVAHGESSGTHVLTQTALGVGYGCGGLLRMSYKNSVN
jgi:hypothetical protein